MGGQRDKSLAHRETVEWAAMLVAAAAVVAVALFPWATYDIGSMAGLWSPKIIRAVIGICALVFVASTVLRVRRIRQQEAMLESEIEQLKHDGDMTSINLAKRLAELSPR